MHLIKRNTCRVCGSAMLTPVIDLGRQYLQGAFVKPDRPAPCQRRIPTALVRCDPTRDERACGLVQMSHTVPPEVLYSSYWYRSGTNATMRNHLRTVVEEAESLVDKDRAPVRALDIGCNDGTLLDMYPHDVEKYGIDPCDIAREIQPPVHVVNDFFPSPELDVLTRGKSFSVITAIAMFYDLEDPVAFVREVKRLLSPDGIWIFEVASLPVMLANTSYDTICHEHVEYYSLAVVERILRMAGMKAVKVSRNTINGGSIRVVATHDKNPTYDTAELRYKLAAMRRTEFDLELDTDKPYRAFRERVSVHKDELFTLLRTLKAEGARIHVYGSSTKGNTLLQWCGIDSRLVDCAADRNPEKHGATTLGTGISIVSEEASRAAKPDYYLVLPWHFKAEFLEREKAALEAGVGFIFPLPKIEIVRKEV